MKATRKLLKDLATVALGFGIFWLFLSVSGNMNNSSDLFMCFMCSGVVFGWKYASKLFVALSWWALFIKAILAVVIGIFAMPVILIADIINVVIEFRAERAC